MLSSPLLPEFFQRPAAPQAPRAPVRRAGGSCGRGYRGYRVLIGAFRCDLVFVRGTSLPGKCDFYCEVCMVVLHPFPCFDIYHGRKPHSNVLHTDS